MAKKQVPIGEKKEEKIVVTAPAGESVKTERKPIAGFDLSKGVVRVVSDVELREIESRGDLIGYDRATKTAYYKGEEK